MRALYQHVLDRQMRLEVDARIKVAIPVFRHRWGCIDL